MASPDIRQLVGPAIDGCQLLVELETYPVQIRMPYLAIQSIGEPETETCHLPLPLDVLKSIISGGFKRLAQEVQSNWKVIKQYGMQQTVPSRVVL